MDPNRAIGYLLADAVRLLRRDFRERSGGLKLTPALARLLFYVHRDPGLCQSDLATRLDITTVTLGRMVDRLVERGYVSRELDPGDRRMFRVYVAKSGMPLVVQMEKVGALTAERAMFGLTRRQKATLVTHLARICHNLTDQVPPL
jgi:DNA-binding MarR family transcriptional regulator